MRSPYGSNIPSAWHLSVTSVSCNSESPVPLTRTTWKAYHGDTGAGATYESPPPTSTWPHRAFCGDTDLLESVTFVCTDWEEAIVEACPPPDSGRGRGPTETSGRKTTQETLGGAYKKSRQLPASCYISPLMRIIATTIGARYFIEK